MLGNFVLFSLRNHCSKHFKLPYTLIWKIKVSSWSQSSNYKKKSSYKHKTHRRVNIATSNLRVHSNHQKKFLKLFTLSLQSIDIGGFVHTIVILRTEFISDAIILHID